LRALPATHLESRALLVVDDAPAPSLSRGCVLAPHAGDRARIPVRVRGRAGQHGRELCRVAVRRAVRPGLTPRPVYWTLPPVCQTSIPASRTGSARCARMPA